MHPADPPSAGFALLGVNRQDRHTSALNLTGNEPAPDNNGTLNYDSNGNLAGGVQVPRQQGAGYRVERPRRR